MSISSDCSFAVISHLQGVEVIDLLTGSLPAASVASTARAAAAAAVDTAAAAAKHTEGAATRARQVYQYSSSDLEKGAPTPGKALQHSRNGSIG